MATVLTPSLFTWICSLASRRRWKPTSS
jgi:hypothetical protein